MKHSIIIELSDLTADTISNRAGFQLYSIIDKNFEIGNSVQLSLRNCEGMTSSFLNSSFGELVGVYGLEFIKEHLSLINYKKSTALTIKKYLDDVSSCIQH